MSVPNVTDSRERGTRWLGTITADVALDPGITPTAKAVYLVLALHADRQGYCYPSGTAIAKAIGRARSGVNRALDELEEARIIRKEARFSEGRRTSNGYTLLDIQAIRGAR